MLAVRHPHGDVQVTGAERAERGHVQRVLELQGGGWIDGAEGPQPRDALLGQRVGGLDVVGEEHGADQAVQR